jgi:hypothetical protein
MTLFDIIVPVAALAVAGVVVLVVRATDKPDHSKHHPAE